MRYAPQHKTLTRNRILGAAGRLFRRNGYTATSIDAVMAEAGLTRGGFYHHFRSKAALFAEIARSDHHLVRLLERRDDATPDALAAGTKAIVDFYLQPENREIVAKRCSFAALTIDAGRGPPVVREAFAEALGRLSHELSRGLPDPAEHDPRALAAAALSIGGFMLANASADETLAIAMLRACRDEVRRLIEPVSAAGKAD
jgi:AcrR family transcriptional regulator